jgi:Tol biopolymer transport system component/DNA-binding winged helix-turn-helix (wHTH) protein
VFETLPRPRLVAFGSFEVDLPAGELRKAGKRLKLTGQPFQILCILLERAGEVVTREELRSRLWPDTFVDVDHNLNTAVNKIREVLGDSAESPRFVETLPRRGYRFIVPVQTDGSDQPKQTQPRNTRLLPILLGCAILVTAALAILAYSKWHAPTTPMQGILRRLTFDSGLQSGVTWSPDGTSIAYSSDFGGSYDIWVQAIDGGDPVRITKGPGPNWQPAWSPDGRSIAYRSEGGDGGLYVISAHGGSNLAQKIVSFGYNPHWSPDGQQILFQSTRFSLATRFYVVDLRGSAPREILADLTTKLYAICAAWHPDGKRVTVRTWDAMPSTFPSFWTAPIAGGPAIRSEVNPDIFKTLQTLTGTGIVGWAESDASFAWAPSGNAIYLERSMRRARNLWRLNVDPESLRVVGIERLTTGPSSDTELALSADGKKIAFTGESRQVRAWMFPFDANSGRILGPSHPISPEAVEAWEPNLSPDGKSLAFCGRRADKWDLWVVSVTDGHEIHIGGDDYTRDRPQWSPDSARLAYTRTNLANGTIQMMLWSKETGEEQPLADPDPNLSIVYDWPSDTGELLASRTNAETQNNELWAIPLSAAPHAQQAARKIIADPALDMYQPHLSPNGRWIVFEGVQNVDSSSLYVVPAPGGPWKRITNSGHWDDKPRWAPDGKTIYYLSERGGFFNVWGIRFDPAKGEPVGKPFQISSVSTPNLMTADIIPTVELSISQDQLVITLEQVSGSIWMLDSANR